MSYNRSLFSDFDPIFLQLVSNPHSGNPSSQRSSQNQARQAITEVTEEGHEYHVRAELPGVPKNNVDVHIGNDGRSLTIEGHIYRTNKTSPDGAQSPQGESASGQDVTKKAEQTGTYEYRSSFSRTVGFHHPVDANKVQANYVDGVLTLTLPKRVESGRQKISLA